MTWTEGRKGNLGGLGDKIALVLEVFGGEGEFGNGFFKKQVFNGVFQRFKKTVNGTGGGQRAKGRIFGAIADLADRAETGEYVQKTDLVSFLIQ